MGPKLMLKSAVESFGYWDVIYKFYRTKRLAGELIDHYGRYPDRPESLSNWQTQRDNLMDRIYEQTGADAKY
jgi:hypothetical protein